MSGWKSVRLAEVLQRSSEVIQPTPDAEYSEITVRLWGNGVVERGRVTGLEMAGRRFVAREGQFIASRIDARNGAMGLVPSSLDGALVTNDFPLFEINRDRLCPSYLGWLCRTASFVELCQRASEGTTNRVRLKEGAFLALEIPLPPLPEQLHLVARINEIVDQLAKAIAAHEEVLHEVQGLLVALTHRADLGDERKSEAGWVKTQLDALLVPTQQAHKVLSDGSYPNCGIYSFGKGLFEKLPISGLSSSAQTLNRIRTGQFIYSRLFAFEGAYAMVDKRFDGFFVSSEYPTFECRADLLLPEFLVAYLKPKSMWARFAEGSKGLGDRRQRVQPEQLLRQVIWLPPLKEQRRVAIAMREAKAFADARAASRAELDALLPAILDRAFVGDL